MIDIRRTSDHISALVDLVQTTSAENQKLTEENQKLTEKNQELINLIKDLSREQEMEM